MAEDAYQPLSNPGLPTSSSLRSPVSSPENSKAEDSQSLPIPVEDRGRTSMGSVLEDATSTCHESPDSIAEYTLTTKLPQRPRTFESGKLLNKFRCHRPFRTETKFPPPTSSSILKLWKWEILNCVLAIGMLGAMYVILVRYDGRRIPDWGTTINLNTLAALISTLLRALLVFVVAEIIGQAKWEYFAGEGRPTEEPPVRRLIETSRFNDASQGLLGAVKLLPTIVRDPATLLAIIVMIISLGTGSFVQQAIQTQSCQFAVDSVNASLPISRNTTAGSSYANIVFGPLDTPNVVGALSSALAPDNEAIGSPISVGCPTGNCTFHNSIGGAYSTLGVCTSCVDTSSLITLTGQTVKEYEFGLDNESTEPTKTIKANYTLPNGMTVQAIFDNVTSPGRQGTEALVSSSSVLGLGWAGDLVSPEMRKLSQWAFANVTVLTPNWLPTSLGYTDYVAATCTLYPCLRSYKASVTSGELDEVLVSTVPAVPNVAAVFAPNTTTEALQIALSGDGWDGYIYRTGYSVPFQTILSPCLANDTVWTKANETSTLDTHHLMLLHADPDASGTRRFSVENTTAPAECTYSMDTMAVSDFRKLINDTLLNGNCSGWSQINTTENTLRINCGKAYWLARFYNDDDDGTTAASIIRRFEAFADRLSNKLRMGLLNNPEAVSGQVLQAAVCSRIHYSWLIFPAVLVALTSGLLAWTMFQSSRRRGREMVWKTSILPFLFYGERFVVQNGEDVSAYSTEESRRDGPKEPLLNLGQMEAEAKQRVVRFDVLD